MTDFNLWGFGDCASVTITKRKWSRLQQILGFSHRSYQTIIGSDSHSVNQTLCLCPLCGELISPSGGCVICVDCG